MFSKLTVLACFLAVIQARVIDVDIPYVNSRVVGGEDAQPGEFPHQVSLQTGVLPNTRHFCGGTILNDRWILTAIHCIQAYEGSKIYVKAGKNNVKLTEESEQVVLMESYILHENYTGHMEVGPYDIALIKLSSPLKFNKYVSPIALPKRGSEPTGTAILSGWGRTTAGGVAATILQKADLEIVDRATCKKAVSKAGGNGNLVHETNICTGPLSGGLGGCNGDSGGPLIIKGKNGKTELIGVASWIITPCGGKGAPTVYGRVSSFIDWIENKMLYN